MNRIERKEGEKKIRNRKVFRWEFKSFAAHDFRLYILAATDNRLGKSIWERFIFMFSCTALSSHESKVSDDAVHGIGNRKHFVKGKLLNADSAPGVKFLSLLFRHSKEKNGTRRGKRLANNLIFRLVELMKFNCIQQTLFVFINEALFFSQFSLLLINSQVHVSFPVDGHSWKDEKHQNGNVMT